MSDQAEGPVFLLPEEAAEILHVGVRTLERWRQTAQGPDYHKHGKQPVYWLADLVKWSESQRRTSTGAKAQEATS